MGGGREIGALRRLCGGGKTHHETTINPKNMDTIKIEIRLPEEFVRKFDALYDAVMGECNAPAVEGKTADEQDVQEAKPAPNYEAQEEEVRSILKALQEASDVKTVKALLSTFGCKKLSDVKPAQYDAVVKEAYRMLETIKAGGGHTNG